MTYDAAFFDVIDEGCRSSAAVVVPLVHRIVQPTTVIDVGCGRGHWAKAFEKLGCKVAGIDGPDTKSILDDFHGHDLTLPLPELGRFDLAVSLEVAEHLPPHRAETFIADLCLLAPVVLFSAAIPGQGGTGHLNEQWPAYWVDLFKREGYGVSGALRWQIWMDDRVENWYRANTLIATNEPESMPELFDTPLAAPFPLVHPVLYDARRR